MRVLVVNAGSSSLKLRVLSDADEVVASVDAEPGDVEALEALAGGVEAVGHRVVHGGERFREPVVLDDGVVEALRALTDLAPLHQPPALDGIAAARAALPDVPHVACFDTAFHATLPAAASTYALPAQWRERFGLRRYGFHGLAHAWVSRQVAERLDRVGDPSFRVVTCHLGSGASLCAVRGGRSVDTTMGFTPLEGLVMATRSGTVDPGLVLWLQQVGGLGVEEVADGLEHRSGLEGLAGTRDMRAVLAAADGGDERAALALDTYVHVVARHVGAMAASSGGVDALAFSGGVGERSPEIRARIEAKVAFLGAPSSVVEAREDLEIASGVRGLLAGQGSR